jgi:hypothetical protein
LKWLPCIVILDDVKRINVVDITKILSEREGQYILWETAFPHGKLKGDCISVREPDGREISGGRLEREVLDHLIRERVVKHDGSPTQQDKLIFRLVA